MSLSELYQATIKAHSRQPIGVDAAFDADIELDAYNPNCGDELTLYWSYHADQATLNNVGFHADACAICIAACSIFCQQAKNQPQKQFIQIAQEFASRLKTNTDLNDSSENFENVNALPADLISLLSVTQYPSRVNCALLPWQTFIHFCSNPKANREFEIS